MTTPTKLYSALDTAFLFIKDTVKGPLHVDNENHDLSFNNDLGKGEISGTRLKNGMALLQFEVNFNEQFTFKANFNTTNILTFGYCSLGGLKYKSDKTNASITIDHFQTVIFNNSTDSNASFTFEKGKTTKMSLILIDKEAAFSEYSYDFKAQLFNAFKTNDVNKDFFYLSSYNLIISEQIARLNALNTEGIVKKIMTESIVYNILGLELQQHLLDKKNAEENIEGLSKFDYKTIKDISDYIKNNPEVQHRIDPITNKYRISPLKLQTGFKILHNATFIEHVKNIRLEKAEELFRTTELNVSEVIYSVGFTSKSYFSKIFKARYKCSPSHYKQFLSTQYKMIA